MRKIAYLLFALLIPGIAFGSSQKLLKATAAQVVLFGPIVDATDATAETGLTIVPADVLVCQDSASCGDKNESTNLAHVGIGVYTVTLDATDTAAEESVCIILEEAGTLPLMQCYEMQSDAFSNLQNGDESLMTSRQAGNVLETDFASVTSQTIVVLTAGAPNDDAYIFGTAAIVGDSVGEECFAEIVDYAQATKTLTLRAKYNSDTDACPFTMAATDVIRIHAFNSGAANDTVSVKVDTAQTDITSVKSRTDQLQFTVANQVDVNAQAIWDIQCEDQGAGYTCQEALSILLAEAAGTAVYTSGTRTWVVKDPSGTETRLTIVYGAELDGDRTSSTPAPMTP